MPGAARARWGVALVGALVFHAGAGALLSPFARNAVPSGGGSARLGNFSVSLNREGPRADKRPAAKAAAVKTALESGNTRATETGSPDSGDRVASQPGAGGAGLADAFLARLRARIEAALEYPVSLRRRGISGIVLIQIVLNPDGSLRGFGIEKSSGHPELDALAERAVRKALESPEPDARAWHLSLPVEFRIN